MKESHVPLNNILSSLDGLSIFLIWKIGKYHIIGNKMITVSAYAIISYNM